MKEKIKGIVAIDLIFLTLLLLSGTVDGAVGDAIYYSAFLIPIGIGSSVIVKMRKSGDVTHGISLCIKRDGVLTLLPIILPSIGLTCLISYLTTLVMSLFGITNDRSFTDPFIISVLLHALTPAVLEEILFRYIPLKLLSENRRTAVIVSALFFSFAHMNLFQIPYAFVAGIVFALIDIAQGSILPSLIIHFLNNTLSLALMYGFGGAAMYTTLAILLILSLALIVIRRRHYAKLAAESLSGKLILTDHTAIFILLSLALTLTNLLG